MQQRKPIAKTKIKNLINGKVLERNFHQNETFEEAEIEKETVKYITITAANIGLPLKMFRLSVFR